MIAGIFMNRATRNPPWARDELILALDYFFRHRDRSPQSYHPGIIELSRVLNSLPLNRPYASRENFRSPSSVKMKLENFLRFAPDYKGKALKAGSKMEGEIWKEYEKRKDELHGLAERIISVAADAGLSSEILSQSLTDEAELSAPEGEVMYRLHRFRERDRRLVSEKKKKVLRQTGTLACEACAFNFKKTYGEIGEGFIECHHTKPLASLKAGDTTKLSDLALLCSNCHRVIHRANITMDELRARLTKLP